MPKKIHYASADDTKNDRWFFMCPGCDNSWHAYDRRWTFNGDVEKPTFRASLLTQWNDNSTDPPTHHVCHLFMTDGRIEYCGDSTHALAGQTVDVPDWED